MLLNVFVMNRGSPFGQCHVIDQRRSVVKKIILKLLKLLIAIAVHPLPDYSAIVKKSHLVLFQNKSNRNKQQTQQGQHQFQVRTKFYFTVLLYPPPPPLFEEGKAYCFAYKCM